MNPESWAGPEHTLGIGNVYSDLGLEDAIELSTRSRLGFFVHKLLTDRATGTREIATLLGIKPTSVSHLMNGHFSQFTTDELLNFLERLDQTVSIRIRPRRPGEPSQAVELETQP